jgi:hypothetical protein
MKLWVSISLAVAIVVQFSIWVYADILDFPPEELESFLQKVDRDSSFNYIIPLFDCRDRVVGAVKGFKGDRGAYYEFVFHGDQLVGIGLGGYLQKVLMEAQELTLETIGSHFGDKAEFLDAHLIYVSPVSFRVRIFYRYGDTVLNDLYLKSDSLRFTLAECLGTSLTQENDRLREEEVSKPDQGFSWVEVRYNLPFWEYYLSSLSNAVVTLADYWKSRGVIRVPIYPDDANFLLTNVRLMMQDVEMLRRKCACESIEIGVSEILEKFIDARGGSVKVVSRDTFSKGGERPLLGTKDIKRLVELENQPFLFECRSRMDTNYGIGIGYLSTSKGFFVESLLPTKSIDGVRWERYFFRWAATPYLRVYEVYTESEE